MKQLLLTILTAFAFPECTAQSPEFEDFVNPDKSYYPEVWVDCLCGNLSKEGVLADLEAISEAGFSGVEFFFGNRAVTI